MCHILSCYFWSVYSVFSDFADVLDAPFLAGVLLCPCTPKWDRNDLSDSVDPIRLRTQKQYGKGLHCLTVNLRFC